MESLDALRQHPMIEKKYPRPEWGRAFMKTVDDPSTGKFFVHCAGGRHRTGSMGAVYRFEKYGWGYEQAYAEMKQFDSTPLGARGLQRPSSGDYARQMQAAADLARGTAGRRARGSARVIAAGKNENSRQ